MRTIGWSCKVVVRYKKEVLRLLAEVAFGTGALAVIGGTVVIVIFMTFFTGLEVGQQGYTSLNSLGAAVYTGFISAYFNTREIAPIIAGYRAVGDGRLRLHRTARRHARQRGNRRARSHRGAVGALPGDHPADRRRHSP